MRKYKTCGGVFNAAARYIEEHGWCRNALENKKGHVCILGGINMASSCKSFVDPYDRSPALNDCLLKERQLLLGDKGIRE